MMHVGDIISTVEDTILCHLSTVEDIMIHVGVFSTQITKDFSPRYCNPHSTAHTLYRVTMCTNNESA